MFAASLLWLCGLPGGWVLDDFSLLSLQFPAPLFSSARPLTYLTYWLNFALGPSEPWAFRLVNIALHAGAVQFCFRALSRPLGEQRAFWAALLFALHPLQAEAVLYIFARPVLVMAVLLWAGLEAWWRDRYWPAVGMGALALLAKEEAIAFPLLLFAIHLSSGQAAAQRFPLIVSFGCAFLGGVQAILNTGRTPGSGAGSQAGISSLSYLATQTHSIALYLLHSVVPFPLVFDAPPEVAPTWHLLFWLLPLALLYVFRRQFSVYGPAFWCLAALCFLFPSSTVFPLADLSADRRMYLPIACLAAATFPLRRLSAAAVTLLAIFSLGYCQLWREPQRLWQWSYDHTRSLRPALELARLLPAEDAMLVVESRRSVGQANPNFHTELGRIEMTRSNPAAALRHFGKALALDPERASHYYNRGVALDALGQKEAAQADFARALAIDPQHELAARAIAAK